jgi:hypothetical protein
MLADVDDSFTEEHPDSVTQRTRARDRTTVFHFACWYLCGSR